MAGRGVGLTDLLRAEGWPLVAVGLLSQLGDVWFLLLIGGVLHVASDDLPVERRRATFVFALGFAYVALVEALKPVVALPRPPGATVPPAVPWLPPALAPLVESVTTAEPPGFPSGHALGSTVVWGGLALVLDRGRVRTRLGVAGAVVTLVSLSRLVLGVHYAVDVLAGVALGVVTLAALYRASERGTRPGRVLLAGAVVGAAGLLAVPTFDGAMATGSAAGGWLAWRAVTDATPGRRAVGVALLALAAGGLLAVYALEPPLPVALVGAALVAALAVAAPTLSERVG